MSACQGLKKSCSTVEVHADGEVIRGGRMKMHESATQHVVITCPYLQQGLCRAENYESCPEGELSNLPRDFGARTEKLRLWVMGDYLSKSKSYVRMPSRDQERGATVNENV